MNHFHILQFFYLLSAKKAKIYSNSIIRFLYCVAINELNDSQFSSEITVIKIPANSPGLSGSLQRINEEEIIFNGHFFDIICERIAEDTLHSLNRTRAGILISRAHQFRYF